MKQLILTQFPWPTLPTMALLIFLVFFVGVIVVAYMRPFQASLNAAAQLPLEDGILENGEHNVR